MGFLTILEASKLSASYDIFTQTLTLEAEGTVAQFAYGFEFKPITAYKFSLEAWVGPLTGKTENYTWTQKFHQSILPGIRDVFIVDEGHPHGQRVPIQFVGIPIPSPTTGDPPAEQPKVTSTTSQNKLTVLFKEPFDISAVAEVPKFGSIDIKYDQSFLTLETAGINDTNIVWNFNSVQVGDTQIIVTIHGGIAQFVKRVVYDVTIIVLELGPGPVIIQDGPSPLGAFDVNEIPLGYLGRANIGMRKILKEYPKAVPYYVDAKSPNPAGVNSPYLLPQMRVMAYVDGFFVWVDSTSYATFGPVERGIAPILIHAPIQVPVAFDATEANLLLREAGIKGPYSALGLLNPFRLAPADTVEQNYYVFHMKDGKNVYVGTKDKKVTIG